MAAIRTLITCWCVLFVAFAAPAGAQPAASNAVVKLVVPFAPGGSTDFVARLLAPKVAQAIGRQVIVENKPGAGGNLGSGAVAAAAADGNTLLLNGTAPLTIGAVSGQPMSFDPFKDLVPIGMVTQLPNVVVVSATLPIRSIDELVAYARVNPRKLGFGTSGIGNLSHLNGEMFANAAGIELLAVPYRGSSAVIADLMSGTVQLSFDNLPPYLPHIKAGTLRALAVTSAKRSSLLPEVPALSEVGFASFDNPAIFAIWGPKGLATASVAEFNKAFNDALRDPDVIAQLKSQAIEPLAGTPKALADRMNTERDLYSRIVSSANIKFQ